MDIRHRVEKRLLWIAPRTAAMRAMGLPAAGPLESPAPAPLVAARVRD